MSRQLVDCPIGGMCGEGMKHYTDSMQYQNCMAMVQAQTTVKDAIRSKADAMRPVKTSRVAMKEEDQQHLIEDFPEGWELQSDGLTMRKELHDGTVMELAEMEMERKDGTKLISTCFETTIRRPGETDAHVVDVPCDKYQFDRLKDLEQMALDSDIDTRLYQAVTAPTSLYGACKNLPNDSWSSCLKIDEDHPDVIWMAEARWQTVKKRFLREDIVSDRYAAIGYDMGERPNTVRTRRTHHGGIKLDEWIHDTDEHELVRRMSEKG